MYQLILIYKQNYIFFNYYTNFSILVLKKSCFFTPFYKIKFFDYQFKYYEGYYITRFNRILQ